MSLVQTPESFVLRAEDLRVSGELEAVQRGVRTGAFVRVRRGAYVLASTWAGFDARQRHVVLAGEVAHVAQGDVAVAGRSAAAIWGLEVDGAYGDDVTLLAVNVGGGKSERGVRYTSAGAAAGLSGAVVRHGIRVTNLVRTALDVARTATFPAAVAVLDAALGRMGADSVTKDDLWREFDRAAFRSGCRQLAAAIEFASALSDSIGESKCRAVMHLIGFPTPILQRPVFDDQGRMDPDFTWLDHGAFGEFDGMVKYTLDRYTQGDPAAALWREKQREDRLRRILPTVVRIITPDVEQPRRLERLLLEVGIPRARSGPPAWLRGNGAR